MVYYKRIYMYNNIFKRMVYILQAAIRRVLVRAGSGRRDAARDIICAIIRWPVKYVLASVPYTYTLIRIIFIVYAPSSVAEVSEWKSTQMRSIRRKLMYYSGKKISIMNSASLGQWGTALRAELLIRVYIRTANDDDVCARPLQCPRESWTSPVRGDSCWNSSPEN